jgi:hypothetical protein
MAALNVLLGTGGGLGKSKLKYLLPSTYQAGEDKTVEGSDIPTTKPQDIAGTTIGVDNPETMHSNVDSHREDKSSPLTALAGMAGLAGSALGILNGGYKREVDPYTEAMVSKGLQAENAANIGANATAGAVKTGALRQGADVANKVAGNSAQLGGGFDVGAANAAKSLAKDTSLAANYGNATAQGAQMVTGAKENMARTYGAAAEQVQKVEKTDPLATALQTAGKIPESLLDSKATDWTSRHLDEARYGAQVKPEEEVAQETVQSKEPVAKATTGGGLSNIRRGALSAVAESEAFKKKVLGETIPGKLRKQRGFI